MSSQSDKILEIIAITGELSADALHRLHIKESYRYKLMTALKDKKLIKCYYRDSVKGYRLTVKAKKILLQRNPERFAYYLQGNVETNKYHSELTRRLRLHHSAHAIITLMHSDVKLFDDEKPPLFSDILHAGLTQPSKGVFYNSRQIKDLGIEYIKIRSSRAVGALFTESQIILIYNTGSNLMKWEYQTELRTKSLINSQFFHNYEATIYTGDSVNGLMLGTDMDTAYLLLTSTGGYRQSFFRLNGSFDRFYYAPNTPEGETQLRILCSNSVTSQISRLLLSDMLPRDDHIRIEHDALGTDHIPVLLAFDFDMERIRRFHDSLEILGQKGQIFCMDFQKPVLDKYLGDLAYIQTISLRKIERRFFAK